MKEGSQERTCSPEASVTGEKRRRRRRVSRVGYARRAVQAHSSTLLTSLTALVVLGSLLAVGTVHVITLLFVAPLALLAGALALWVEDDSKRRIPVPAIIATTLAGYSWLQSVPLTPRCLKTLSPIAAQTWLDAFKLTDTPATRWASISVDPGASRVEALKWLCYAAMFAAAARLAREKGSQRGATIVLGTALVGGLLSLAHGLFGVEDWLGLYHPQLAHAPWATAPLLNPNNFAGYLNLGLFVGIGMLFVRKPIAPRWAVGITVIILAALVVLTASRGGVMALIVGFGMSGFAYWAQQARAKARGGFLFPPWIPLTAVGLAAGALAVIGSTDVIWQQLLDETTGKLRIAEYSMPVVRDHLWTGIGRGAFETAFAAYRQEPGHHIVQYAENFVVQWIVEWGLPVAAIALLALFWTLRPKRLGFARNALPTGIVVGVSALLLQNLVDLASEVASVGIAAAVLLGTAMGGAQYFDDTREQVRASRRKTELKRKPTSSMIRSAMPTAAAVACLGSGFALVWLVARTGIPDAIDERNQLATELADLVGKKPGDPGFSRVRAQVGQALLRHPADPYIPVVGALLTREAGKSPLAWLNQALRRDPLNARAHLLLAETLAARGAMNQAMMELRKAVECGPELVGEVAARASRWSQTVEDLLRAVPGGERGIPMLNALARRFSGTVERVALRNELLVLALKRNSADVDTNSIIAHDLLAAMATDAGPCSGDARAACNARLSTHATSVLQNATNPQTSTILRGELLAHAKKWDEAERWLAGTCDQLPDPVSCAITRITYALKLGDSARFDEACSAYTAVACSTSTSCSRAFLWLGQIELGRKNLLGALSRFERAAQESPSSETWIRVADVAIRVGRIGRAQSALAAARRFGMADGLEDYEKRLQEIQRAQLLQNLSTEPAPTTN